MNIVDRYLILVSWSDDDEAFLATCPAFPTLSAFGDTPEEAVHEARLVLEGFVEIYQEDGLPLPEPENVAAYSGRLNLRMPKTLHYKLARLAETEGISLNTLIITRLSESLASG